MEGWLGGNMPDSSETFAEGRGPGRDKVHEEGYDQAYGS